MLAPDVIDELKSGLRDVQGKLEAIQLTLSTIAVQDERIRQAELKIDDLYRQYNDRTIPKLEVVANHQASCPRGQIKMLWLVVVPQGLVLIGIALTLVSIIMTNRLHP